MAHTDFLQTTGAQYLAFQPGNIIQWWCDKGIDGFRMDAIAYIGKESFEDGIKDAGCLYAPFDQRTANRPLAHTYLREMSSE